MTAPTNPHDIDDIRAASAVPRAHIATGVAVVVAGTLYAVLVIAAIAEHDLAPAAVRAATSVTIGVLALACGLHWLARRLDGRLERMATRRDTARIADEVAGLRLVCSSLAGQLEIMGEQTALIGRVLDQEAPSRPTSPSRRRRAASGAARGDQQPAVDAAFQGYLAGLNERGHVDPRGDDPVA